MMWQKRYKTSYEKWQEKEYPSGYKNFGYLLPKYPKVSTSNGLTRFIIDFLKFEGWRATRINTMGRLIDKTVKTESGATFTDKKYIHSSTRNGTADVSATIKGRSVMIEVKIHPDKPRESQLAEQARERAAGGIYEFCYTPEEFLLLYDRIMTNDPFIY